MQQTNKVALITGANKGIGYEVARQIAKSGWTVLAAARNEELGRQAVARLQAEGLKVQFVPIDLDRPETAITTAETIRSQFSKLDLLINNAAIATQEDGPPSKVNLEAVRRSMQTNFIGTIAVTQAMLPLLLAGGKGPNHQRLQRSRLYQSADQPGLEVCPGEGARLLRFEGRAEHVDRSTGLRVP